MTRNLLTWTIDLSAACSEEAAPHYADFGRGRYSVGKAIGSRPCACLGSRGKSAVSK
jgi:hypothetical protein